MEDSEARTQSDNTGLNEVKSQVPDPTNRGQTSQEECCSEGNLSVRTGVFEVQHTHIHANTDGLSLTRVISGHIWLCTGNVPSSNYHFCQNPACEAAAVDTHEKGFHVQVRMAFQAN